MYKEAPTQLVEKTSCPEVQRPVGELLDNRASRSVFQRRFGKFMNHPLVGASRSLTLAQLAEMAAVWLPQRTIQETIQELRQL